MGETRESATDIVRKALDGPEVVGIDFCLMTDEEYGWV